MKTDSLRFTLHPDARPLDDAIREAEAIIQRYVALDSSRGIPIGKLVRRVVRYDGNIIRIEWWEEK